MLPGEGGKIVVHVVTGKEVGEHMVLFDEQQGKLYLHGIVLSIMSEKQLFTLTLSAVDSLFSVKTVAQLQTWWNTVSTYK